MIFSIIFGAVCLWILSYSVSYGLYELGEGNKKGFCGIVLLCIMTLVLLGAVLFQNSFTF